MYIECVPNISEGIDLDKIESIVNAARTVDGCVVLGVEPDADYNRTVITLAGLPENVYEGTKALVIKAIHEIDMRQHKGEHPRLGAVDVCPFVPLESSMKSTCIKLAKRLAKEIHEESKVCTYLYGFAAQHEAKIMLSDIRKGQYEGLQDRFGPNAQNLPDEIVKPDFGQPQWNEVTEKSGCITIGARDILIAYNVNVHEQDASISKKIGSLVRSSGRPIKNGQGQTIRLPGLLSKVQGMGVQLERMGISQVSMNILDRHATPIHTAFLVCQTLGEDHGVKVAGSEIVGLIPLQTMLEAGEFFAKNDGLSEHDLVEAAIEGLGLREFHDFDPAIRIIEWAIAKELTQ
ncbi:MAG: glutamate formimidoyltransferase [Candidatus Poseidoniales archaeon]